MLRRLGPAYQALKTALAAGLAWQLATYLSANHSPYFAPLAVILTLQATVADTLSKALFRVGGMVGGVVISMLVERWLPLGALAISLSLLLGMAIGAGLRLNPAVTSQVGVTALMVLVSQGKTHYALDRVLETALGAVVAIGVNAVLVPPDLTPMAEKRMAGLAELLAKSLSDLADGAIESVDRGILPRSRVIEHRVTDAREALQAARQSIRYNPFMGRRRARLNFLALVLPELEKMAIQVRGVLRGVGDLGAAGESWSAGLGDALRETAACIGALGRVVAEPAGEARGALDGALARARDSQARCLSYLKEMAPLTALREVGAILTDLNRMLLEVDLAVAEMPQGE